MGLVGSLELQQKKQGKKKKLTFHDPYPLPLCAQVRRTFVQRAAAAVVAVAVVAQPVAPALAYNNNSNGVSEARISKLCASNATSKTCTDSIGRAGLRDGTKQSATS